ncbi:MAG: DEAD/DEAH box helicase [Candidatus Sericytochromatia bacterium]|nr:DEAD/DEAH box helicase [Candidatus Sericytochromatia bacterium]
MSAATDFSSVPAFVERLAADGIQAPSPIQAMALPVLLTGRDAVLAAQTGSGKTLAYMLPLLARLQDPAPAPPAPGRPATPRLVVLVPTQELGLQVREVARRLLEGTDRRVVAAIGGANPARQVEALRRGADVLVGTPGRVVDMLGRHALSLVACRALVLDEVDRLAEPAHRGDAAAIVLAAPAARQVVAASATVAEEAAHWVQGLMRTPEVLRAAEDLTLPATLRHQVLVVDERDQLPMLRRLVAHLAPTGAIAFFNRSADIDWLVSKLVHHGVRAAGLHAGLNKLARAEAMRAFRAGRLQVLVATELAARGLDLGGVSLVINLDLPRTAADYAHRVGRTARMGREGTAITLVDPAEQRFLAVLERELGLTFERPVYAFGELRAPTEQDARREARKAREQRVRDAERAQREAAAEAGERPPRKPKAVAGPTARQKAKGKARKAQRKAAGRWKPAGRQPAEQPPASSAPATLPEPPTA